jgi:hypothetical protein
MRFNLNSINDFGGSTCPAYYCKQRKNLQEALGPAQPSDW